MAEGGNWQDYAVLFGGLLTTIGGAMIAHARSLVGRHVAIVENHEARLQTIEQDMVTTEDLEKHSSRILEAIGGVKKDVLEQVGQLRDDNRRTDERLNEMQRDEIARLRQQGAQE